MTSRRAATSVRAAMAAAAVGTALAVASRALAGGEPARGEAGGGATVRGETVRGEASAANVAKGPAVDGSMADPAWEACAPWALGSCGAASPPRLATSARVIFDGTHVHVGVRCEEPDTARLAVRCTRRDDPVWDDDSVEVFLRPDPRGPYCQIIVNPRGTIYDARAKDPAWNAAIEVKTSIEEGRAWIVTLKAPLKDLGALGGPGQTWTANVCRTRPARGGDPVLQGSWAPLPSCDYHAEDEWGTIAGIDVAPGAGVAERAPLPPVERGSEAGGVIVYRRSSFDAGLEGWEAANGARIALVDDGIHGKALEVACEAGWSGARLPVAVRGSKGLKLALLARGRGLPAAGVNFHDAISGDNTTPYGHRYLEDGAWTPILYFLDRCRYNSRNEGFVSPATFYDEVRFHGPQEARPGRAFAIDDLALYRGEDRDPPGPVPGLRADATAEGVRLSWEPAPDNVGIQAYAVSRADGGGAFRKVAERRGTAWVDAAAGEGPRAYRVLAVDFEENLGPWSDPVRVEAMAPAPPIAAARPTATTPEEVDRLAYAERVREIHRRGAGKVRRGQATLFGDSLTGATLYPQCAEAAFGTLVVTAHGFPSMQTEFGRERVGEILSEENPELLLVLFGTNNPKGDADVSRAMDDLAAIVAACEERGTIPVLGTIPPRGWEPASEPEARYDRAVADLCRSLRIPCGYIFEEIQSGGDRRTFIADDGVHWEAAGMAAAARAWARALRQVRFALRDRSDAVP